MSIPISRPNHEGEIRYWKDGTALINMHLAKASKSLHKDAPFGCSAAEALLWHKAQAEAYRHALEMMGYPTSWEQA